MDEFAAKRQALLESGVRMMDPGAVYVEAGVTVGAGPCCSPGPFCGGIPWWERTVRSAPTPCSQTAPWEMAL